MELNTGWKYELKGLEDTQYDVFIKVSEVVA